MAIPLGVTPAELRATAEHLTEVSNRMKGVKTSLDSEITSEGEPWGKDSTGSQFTDGPSGYFAQKDWVYGSIDAKTKLLDDYAQGLRTAADTLEQGDSS